MLAIDVHHISFAVSDLERSRRFYREILGLEEIPRPNFGVPGAWYRAGGTEVHLIGLPEGSARGAPPGAINPLANHQAFAIADYGKALDRLRSRGVDVLETRPEVGQMWIRDPDGNVIELIEPRR